MRGFWLATGIVTLAVLASGGCQLSTDGGAGLFDPAAAGGAAGSGGDDAGGTGGAIEPVCAAGMQVGCACLGSATGIQVCLDDGSGFGPCLGCPEDDAGGGAGGSAGLSGSGGAPDASLDGLAGSGGVGGSSGSDAGGFSDAAVEAGMPVCLAPGEVIGPYGYCLDIFSYYLGCSSFCVDPTLGSVCGPGCFCVPVPPPCAPDSGAPEAGDDADGGVGSDSGGAGGADASAGSGGSSGTGGGDASGGAGGLDASGGADGAEAGGGANDAADAPPGIACCPSTVCPGAPFAFCTNGTCSPNPLDVCDPADCAHFCTQCPDNRPEAGSFTSGTCSNVFGIWSCDCL